MNVWNVFKSKVVTACYIFLAAIFLTVYINRAAVRSSTPIRRRTSTMDTRSAVSSVPTRMAEVMNVTSPSIISPIASSNGSFRVAMVLSGCGNMDGSEIREATCAILALEEAGATIEFFAPDKLQASVVNHTSGTPVSDNRNVLVESARIARGSISPLTSLSAAAFQALVIPGGMGVTSNLCNYSVAREQMQVDATLSGIISSFNSLRKPIGAICIAPVVVAKVLGSKGVNISFGQADAQLVNAVTSWGARHVACPMGRCTVDAANLVVCTPAFMYSNSNTSQVLAGIREMVSNLRSLAAKGSITQGHFGNTEQIR